MSNELQIATNFIANTEESLLGRDLGEQAGYFHKQMGIHSRLFVLSALCIGKIFQDYTVQVITKDKLRGITQQEIADRFNKDYGRLYDRTTISNYLKLFANRDEVFRMLEANPYESLSMVLKRLRKTKAKEVKAPTEAIEVKDTWTTFKDELQALKERGTVLENKYSRARKQAKKEEFAIQITNYNDTFQDKLTELDTKIDLQIAEAKLNKKESKLFKDTTLEELDERIDTLSFSVGQMDILELATLIGTDRRRLDYIQKGQVDTYQELQSLKRDRLILSGAEDKVADTL